MVNINLLPWREERAIKLNRQFYGALIGSLSIIALLLLLINLHLNSSDNQIIEDSNYIKAELKKLDADLKSLDVIKKDRTDMLDEIDTLQEIYIRQTNFPLVLSSIVQAIPTGLFLKSIISKDKNIKIDGYSDTNSAVTKFINNLSAFEWFHQPDLSQIKLVALGSGQQVENLTEFSLSVAYVTKNKDLEAHVSGS